MGGWTIHQTAERCCHDGQFNAWIAPPSDLVIPVNFSVFSAFYVLEAQLTAVFSQWRSNRLAEQQICGR